MVGKKSQLSGSGISAVCEPMGQEEAGSHGCSASENAPNIIPEWRGGRFPDLNPRERFGSHPWNGLACVDRYGRPSLVPSAAKVRYLTVATLSWLEIATRNLIGDQRIAPSRVICSIYGGGNPGRVATE